MHEERFVRSLQSLDHARYEAKHNSGSPSSRSPDDDDSSESADVKSGELLEVDGEMTGHSRRQGHVTFTSLTERQDQFRDLMERNTVVVMPRASY